MINTLENEFYKITVSALGAELNSVFSKKLNKELLWHADKSVWARNAPVLFPIVGKFKDNTYEYAGKEYHLPQHGFARDKEFKVIEKNADSILLELKQTEETYLMYPFHFDLRIHYELSGQLVKCAYTVINSGDKELYFSIGAHPGFICPMFPGEKLADYKIEFEEKEKSRRRLLNDGLFNGANETVFSEPKSFQLSQSLFDKDAIVFDDLKSTSLKLISEKYCLNFTWFNMPYFGIWTKKGTEAFVCLEPWAGISDSLDSSGLLEEKEGIIKLAADKKYQCGFSFYPNAGKDS